MIRCAPRKEELHSGPALALEKLVCIRVATIGCHGFRRRELREIVACPLVDARIAVPTDESMGYPLYGAIVPATSQPLARCSSILLLVTLYTRQSNRWKAGVFLNPNGPWATVHEKDQMFCDDATLFCSTKMYNSFWFQSACALGVATL